MVRDASQDGQEKQSFGRRPAEWFSAIRQTPRVIALVWRAHPTAAVLFPILTVAVGPLPALYLYCGKKVIDGVVLWLQGDALAGRPIVVLFLAVGLGVTLLQHALTHLSRFLEDLLRRRLQQHVQSRVLDRAATLDVAFFETPSFYDKLQRAQQEAGFRSYSILASITHGARDLATLCG